MVAFNMRDTVKELAKIGLEIYQFFGGWADGALVGLDEVMFGCIKNMQITDGGLALIPNSLMKGEYAQRLENLISGDEFDDAKLVRDWMESEVDVNSYVSAFDKGEFFTAFLLELEKDLVFQAYLRGLKEFVKNEKRVQALTLTHIDYTLRRTDELKKLIQSRKRN